MTNTSRALPLGRELAHPLPVVALVALVLNDYVLKGAGVLPAWLTGKLSDFAGLFLLPIVLFTLADAIARACSRALPRRAAAFTFAAATALAFAVLKLHPAPNAAVSAYWGPIALDSTDLFALPMCYAAAAWLAASNALTRYSFGRQGLRYALLIASSLACIATSPSNLYRNYPAWQLLDQGRHDLECAQFAAWVSKSGKQGVGITVELRSHGTGACEVAVRRAVLAIGERPPIPALTLPAAVQLGTVPRHLYVPFAFDNEASWNDDELQAVLALELAVNGKVERLQRQLAHRWSGPHARRRR